MMFTCRFSFAAGICREVLAMRHIWRYTVAIGRAGSTGAVAAAADGAKYGTEAVMSLFERYALGPLELKNRVVMAPMTRCRATGNLANGLMAGYYGQRAGAGLIISEGTSPSPNGLGYARIPGLYSPEQTASWKLVTEAVHTRGGRIFIQLMHAGRVGNVLSLPPGAALLAPSAVAMNGPMWTDSQGELPCDLPREMTPAEIRTAISEY